MLTEKATNISPDFIRALKADNCIILNSNQYENGFGNLLAYSNGTPLKIESYSDLADVQQNSQHKLIGVISYDTKNEIAKLKTENTSVLNWPQYMFFEAEENITFESINFDLPPLENKPQLTSIKQKISKEEYIKSVQKIRDYIREGEVYELNYCIPFTANNVDIDPFQAYQELNKTSPMPFSAFLKFGNKYIISASPERFIKYDGNKLISQPMKGTIRRDTSNNNIDDELKNQLAQNQKERAENLMIVDLVRHDFKKSCKTGSIKVLDLFEVQSFPRVHQMISTITGQPLENISPVEMIRNSFPMGSMTGAPKIRAMELIEELEVNQREMFSGTLGYINSDGTFDFNVLIRTVFYDSDTKTLTFQVGSAITYDSDPEKEYEECLLKAEAIFSSLFDTN